MTNEKHNGNKTRDIERSREASGTQDRLARDDRPKGVTHRRPTNWSWAHGGSGYDWMDSHYFSADFSGAPG